MWDFLELEFQEVVSYLTWVLGTNFKSSAGAVHVLYQGFQLSESFYCYKYFSIPHPLHTQFKNLDFGHNENSVVKTPQLPLPTVIISVVNCCQNSDHLENGPLGMPVIPLTDVGKAILTVGSIIP